MERASFKRGILGVQTDHIILTTKSYKIFITENLNGIKKIMMEVLRNEKGKQKRKNINYFFFNKPPI